METHWPADEALKPAAVRYLLTSALPMMDVAKLGEEKLRELRTLSAALDLVVSGKVSMAGDMLTQRLKSILMSIRDGSTAASRYLELIPMTFIRLLPPWLKGEECQKRGAADESEGFGLGTRRECACCPTGRPLSAPPQIHLRQ